MSSPTPVATARPFGTMLQTSFSRMTAMLVLMRKPPSIHINRLDTRMSFQGRASRRSSRRPGSSSGMIRRARCSSSLITSRDSRTPEKT
ncbi:hypothetical protein ACN28I_42350 [Archangium gephyra]|uniref:hypothetical protein n=1 Tax=Archangium gephyra TaxID=48 RepID=UPI003B7906C4